MSSSGYGCARHRLGETHSHNCLYCIIAYDDDDDEDDVDVDDDDAFDEDDDEDGDYERR